MKEIFDQIVLFCSTTGIRLVLAIVLLLIGFRLIRVWNDKLFRSSATAKIDPGAKTFLHSFVAIAAKIVLCIVAAGMIGIPMTSVVAVLASAGLAIGLALQGALGNLAGGLMILLFRPFRLGDYIDTHADAGTVKEITVFYTVLTTPDNRTITLPNGTLTNTTIINYSAMDTRRVDLTFGVSYASDVDAVKRILLDTANAHPLVKDQPAPFARLLEHGDSALKFVLRVWCSSKDYWDVSFDLLEQVKAAFDKNGIEIPFPQIDVHMDRTGETHN